MKTLVEEFRLRDLSQADQDKLYDTFKSTYEDSTGSAWDRDEFDWKADKWDFYGSIDGGIAVRPQRCGLLKLNASFGDTAPNGGLSRKGFGGVLKGLKDLMAENPGVGIWGAMPKEMVSMLERVSIKECPDNSFKAAPAVIVIALGEKLIKSVSASKDFKVIKNPFDKNFGCIEFKTPAGLPIYKQIVGNKAYYQWLKDQASDKSNQMLQDAIAQLGGVGKFISNLPFFKSDKTDNTTLPDQTADNNVNSDADDIPQEEPKKSLVSQFIDKFRKN